MSKAFRLMPHYLIFFLVLLAINLFSCKSKSKNQEYPDKQPDSAYVEFKNRYEIIPVVNKKQDEVKWLDEIFSNLYKQGKFNGAVLVAEKGEVFYKKVFGYRDIHFKDSLDFNSSFQLASVSKMFTALAIMQLKEQGKVDIDKEVVEYLPLFPYKKMTIRHLLTHHSGLSNYMALSDDHWDRNKPLTNNDMYLLFAKYKPVLYYQPGKLFNYSNTNYAFLALIVEKITNMPFDKYMNDNVFDKIGMKNTYIFRPDKQNGNMVPGYSHYKRGFVQVPENYLNGVMGDKGVYSTVEDMYKFDRALRTDLLISSSSMDEVFTPANPDNKKRKKFYGFGWRIKFVDDDKIVFHFGWWRGFKTGFIRDITHDKTIIILNNTNSFPQATLVWDILSYPYPHPEAS
jgi:CubicO group peptidase (beta-lactamase class C family)